MIRKLIVAMVAATMLVAMAVPAFAQLDLLSPDANATAANAAEQNAAQEQSAALEQNCINYFNQENNQTQTTGDIVGANTVNQENNAANVAIGVEQKNECKAEIEQNQALEQSVNQEANAAAAAWVEFALGL